MADEIHAVPQNEGDNDKQQVVSNHNINEEIVVGDNLNETEVYRILLRICDLVSNTKIQKALQLSEKVKKYSLTAAQLNAEVIQVHSSMEDSEQSFTNCYSLLEAIEQKALSTYNSTKQAINVNKNDKSAQKEHLEAIVTLAEINGMMAMMHGRRSNRVRAAHKARKSWKFYEEGENFLPSIPEWSFDEIIKRDCKIDNARNDGDDDEKKEMHLEKLFGVNRHDHIEGDDLRSHYIISKLYFGLSLFRYGVSMLPPTLQWIIEKFGFPHADREESIAKLDTISRMPASPRQLLATGVLIATKYFFFDEKDTALKAVSEMISAFPDSIFFRVIYAQLQRREGNYELSSESFRIGVKYTEEENLYQANRTLRYELGNNNFAVGNYEEALPLYQQYLETTTSPTFKPYCAFKYCYCLILVQPDKLNENRNKIMGLLKNASTIWVRKEMSYDVWASRLSQQLMKNNLIISDMERHLTLASGYVDAHMFDDATREFEIIHGLLEKQKEADKLDFNDYAHFLYLRGRAERAQKDLDKAIEIFTKLLSNQVISKVNVEKWIIPHAEMEFAEILFEKSQIQSSISILNNCKKRSGYDFEKQLSFSIKRLERKLKVVVVDG